MSVADPDPNHFAGFETENRVRDKIRPLVCTDDFLKQIY